MTLKTVLKKLFLERKVVVPVAMEIDNNKLLKNKIALIIGGNGGIGTAIAEAFLRSGAKVIISGKNYKKLKECYDGLIKQGYEKNLQYIMINIEKIREISEKVNEAVELFEENKIDILVNSAGVNIHKNFFEITEEDFNTIMSINSRGIYFMCQAVSKIMIDKNIHGHILNVTSSGALRPAISPYQMSKWSIRGFTLGLANELLPYGIIVNAIAPGPTATAMLGVNKINNLYKAECPAQRYVLPSEVAALAVYMVSDLANMVVGDTFYITGGSGVISYDI